MDSRQRVALGVDMNEKYETKNLNLAAYLYAKGVTLADSRRIDGVVYFNFSPKEEAEGLIEDYFADNAVVNPRELFSRLNDLRDLIFNKDL